ncbi:hypothetical protein J437_LFUL009936 [Ladona fulva]|uniref:Helitron helicase-like domain-containing protein n=1 Tax=Ladona fulva TaxID=123851 RepID=A0A8K0KE61_LADFU|nr:hypothetical protein J437_LFUL009936 [Ladona fulva]
MERHDEIARVFRQKQTRFMDVIEKCWMYTIERQKPGIPHSHNLIWLHKKNLFTPTDQEKHDSRSMWEIENEFSMYELSVHRNIQDHL